VPVLESQGSCDTMGTCLMHTMMFNTCNSSSELIGIEYPIINFQ
jgi:hypothetical protein